MSIKLTAYSHGAGCGCKLSPAVLQEILSGSEKRQFDQLLVGNESSDDAAVFAIDDQTSIISTTDFFMPIVDDPEDFGAIAATNAISDVYAMGGTPIMAIAILGWPIEKLAPDIARLVLDGARKVCHDINIPLAGGHSIDAPEPIFGLAVTGRADTNHIKKNDQARIGDLLYLSKPLGIGLVTTAEKKGTASMEDLQLARESMLSVNTLGAVAGKLSFVHAVTDVTGFGLAGHLIEMAEASECSAEIRLQDIPRFPFVDKYLQAGMSPGGTHRNWQSYGPKVNLNGSDEYRLIADPQTSGGLLLSVDPAKKEAFEKEVSHRGYQVTLIGQMIEKGASTLFVN